MRIGITTPTGQVGRKVVAELLASSGQELILLTRRPEALHEEEARGAVLLKGDLEDGAFVKRAMKRVKSLFWLTPPNLTADNLRVWQNRIAQNGAEAVRSNDIHYVVVLSSIGAQHSLGCGPVSGLHDVEHIFRWAAPNVAVLRPTWYMENLFFSLASIAKERAIYLPLSGTRPLPMIATKDVAAVAAKTLVNSEAKGVWEQTLLGPREYTLNEAAEIIGRALGQTARFVQTTPDEARAFLVKSGASEDMAAQFVEMYQAIESGHLTGEDPRTPESTTPTSLEEFVETVLAPAIYEFAKA